MTGTGGTARSITPAEISGGVALAAAFALFLTRPEMAALPLVAFVVVCLAAPFFPTCGFFLKVYSRGRTGRSVVALTFDDGPDPETTPLLLDLLRRHGVRATFFVTGEQATRHGDLIAAILAEGHEIGNHSFHHDVFLMCRTSARLDREVARTQDALRPFGVVPLIFRPPVGITNPKLGSVLARHGLSCVTFSCRAYDGGNRFVRGMSRRILRKIRGDDILVLHDVAPKGKATAAIWRGEVAQILAGIAEKGLTIIPLGELLAGTVMAAAKEDGQ